MGHWEYAVVTYEQRRHIEVVETDMPAYGEASYEERRATEERQKAEVAKRSAELTPQGYEEHYLGDCRTRFVKDVGHYKITLPNANMEEEEFDDELSLAGLSPQIFQRLGEEGWELAHVQEERKLTSGAHENPSSTVKAARYLFKRWAD